MVCYKCDYCGKELEVKNEGKLLYPKNVIVVHGEAFVYCSTLCKKKGAKNIVTAQEVNDILESLGHLTKQQNSFVQHLTSY